MSRWQRLLHDASRSRAFLWRFAFGLLALGLGLGYALHHWSPARPQSLRDKIIAALAAEEGRPEFARGVRDLSVVVFDVLQEEIASGSLPFAALLDLVPEIAAWTVTTNPEQFRTVLAEHYPPDLCDLARDLLLAVRQRTEATLQPLETRARSDTPGPHAVHALGLAYFARGEFHAAYAQFRREGRAPEAIGSRRKAVECLVVSQDYETLRAVKGESEYAPLISPSLELKAAIHERDWPAILRAVPRSQFSGLDPAITALALLAGVAWAFFLIHLGQIPGLRSRAALLCALGLLAGIASTTPTIYAVIWQDDMLGLAPEGDFLRSVLYYIGGVGVREELFKLACFLPFVPVLVRRDRELEAFIVASSVGLGFAVQENGSYFLDSSGTAAATRFLTANFFHIALTGMNGLALVRAFTHGTSGLNEFLTVFGATIIAHGLYDALLSMPDPVLGSYLAMAVYVLSCQIYFSRAHELRESIRSTITLTGAFVAGIATLAAAMIAYQTVRLGPAAALHVVLHEFIGTIVLLVMFFREFDEPLAE